MNMKLNLKVEVEIGGRVNQSHLGEASVKENFPHELKFVAFNLKTYKHVTTLLLEPPFSAKSMR